MSVRQMLTQLAMQGYEVQILGATIFDNPKGGSLLKDKAPSIAAHRHKIVDVNDGVLTHQLLVTQNSFRTQMIAHEEEIWLNQYCYLLDSFKPDIVWFYGGQTLELLIADEARFRSIPSAFYLVNGNYMSPRWCRDVALVLTDTEQTAKLYQEKVGFLAKPVGKFIDPACFVAEHHQRKNLTFINPTFEKGASIFVQLALKLEKEHPDISLEVVEARGDWSSVLKEATQLLGESREQLNNVIVTKNTNDMLPVYKRSRVLVAPSLWWESGARVLAEAMLNGIPAIVSNHGGSAGLVENGGILLDFPEQCHEKPYKHILNEEELQPLYDAVVNLFDDEALYQDYVEKAYKVGKEKHHIDVSTARLVQALTPLVAQKAGNKDFSISQRKAHMHKLAGRAKDPGLNVPFEIVSEPVIPSSIMQEDLSDANTAPRAEHNVAAISVANALEAATSNFSWELKGKVVVLDNRAKLIKTGAADKLAKTSAFTILAFDPASEVSNPQAYEGHDHIQLFQHALLGDGQPSKLNACLDAALSSTLTLLPLESLPERHRQGANVLTQLPINTVALDSIEGLPSLDWLILDELSNVSSILEHGEKALKDALLIQARVAFQPTHKNQPSLAELQHWASCNGFRFYRFNDASYQSLFPEKSEAHEQLGSELQSLDALFLPSQERMTQLDDNQKQKLVFLLHTVFDAHDMAYQVMSQVSELQAKNYLQFVEGEMSAPVSSPQALHQLVEMEEESSVPAQREGQKQIPLAEHPTIRSFTQRAASQEPLQPGEKGLFIDCGGYDGCSSLKFMMNNPEFDCVTFEPNPTLWHYYKDAPTFLIKKAAYIHDDAVKFTLDNLDEDGSSLIRNKRIDYAGRVKNKAFPTITAQCVDIARFIQDCEPHYDRIILKMDIEGAEYDILDRLIEKKLLGNIDKLYCEFHWHKCGISKKRHDAIVQDVEKEMPVLDWDALDFSIHKRGKALYDARKIITTYIKECAKNNKIVTEKTIPVFIAKYSIDNIDESQQLEKKCIQEPSYYEVKKNHDMLYEAARKELTSLLGELHGMEQSERFWDIVLHYFLAYKFMSGYVSRWNNSLLNSTKNAGIVFQRFPVDTTMLFGTETFDLISNEAPFFDGHIKLPLATRPKNNHSGLQRDEIVAKAASHIKAKVQPCQGKYAFDLGVHNFPYWKKLWKEEQDADLIQVTLPPIASSGKLNVTFRQKIADLDKVYTNTEKFPGFWSSLALSLPKEFIEDFACYQKAVTTCLADTRPEFIASTLLSTLQARLVAALSVDQGIPLYLQQHGGAYGEFESHLGVAIETRLSDRFYTWGWTHPLKNTIADKPHRIEYLRPEYERYTKKGEDVLIIGPHEPTVPVLWKGTIEEWDSEASISSYIEKVPNNELGNITIRLRRQHGQSQNYEKWLLSALPSEVRVDFQERSIAHAYACAKKVIILTPFSTSAWECEYLGIPFQVLNQPTDEFMQIPSFISETY
ncbi:FkbM family methyltransferase [Halomonas sp. IOP_14]|uniref:FkbM family methyltransferase n=1 Tax=Halomonas sp. IOP_14 TaxID=2873295 RepID=UPI001E42A5D7|nr:FkbM family methyltransferase [Halomonas sp. IOP_14]MCD1588403.1 FkbM family methyltransferase [Halomonas sp. IOP_14]